MQLLTQWYGAGVSNMWPMGRMRPANLLCEAIMQILFWSQNMAQQNG